MVEEKLKEGAPGAKILKFGGVLYRQPSLLQTEGLTVSLWKAHWRRSLPWR